MEDQIQKPTKFWKWSQKQKGRACAHCRWIRSKQKQRQWNQDACGNRAKNASGEFTAMEAFLETFMQTAEERGNDPLRVLSKESKRKEEKENEAEKSFFPWKCGLLRMFSFFALFFRMVGCLHFIRKNTAAFNDSRIVILHNRTSEWWEWNVVEEFLES